METKKVVKLFLAWQDEQEEKWLSKMASEGWHLKGYQNLVYNFVKSEPKNYTYKLDYKTTNNNDLKEYLSLFEAAGWEYVGCFGEWQYFRTAGSHPKDIYTDNQSKIDKYKRLQLRLIFSAIAFLLFTLLIVSNLSSYGSIFLKIFIGVVFLLFAFAVFKISQKVTTLKRSVSS